MAALNKFALEMFDGEGDFIIWRRKMKTILVQLEVFEAVTGEYSPEATAKEITRMNNTAMATLMTHLEGKVIHEMGETETARELWENLIKRYQSSTLPNKVSLQTKFYGFRMDTAKTIKENLEVFYKLIQELAICGERIPDQLKCIILLNALPPAYNSIKEIFQCSGDELSLERLLDSIKLKEASLGSDKREEVMLARWKPGAEGSSKRNTIPKWKRKQERKLEHYGGRKCYYCGKEGHMIKDCRKKTFDQRGKKTTRKLDQTR